MAMEILFTLLIVLTVITLLGHGIWLVVATIIRALLGTSGPDERHSLVCPWCENSTPVRSKTCRWCNRPLFDARARGLADLAAVRRKLQEWRGLGKIPPEQAKAQLLQIESERRILLGQSSPAKTSAPPAPAAPPPQTASQPTTRPAGAPETPVEAILVEPPAEAAPRRPRPQVKPAAPQRPDPSRTPKPPAVQPAPKRQPAPAPTLAPSTPISKPAAATTVKPPIVEPPPRKTWRELVQAFLEERDIPVVELLGVILTAPVIVTGAVMLVIYFWETLQENAVLKFGACAAAPLASMLIGLVACIRWQLKTTGRGLLVISLALVPLSFLSVVSSGGEWSVLLAQIGALAGFGYLIAQVGRVLVPDRPWHLAAAILGPATAIVVLSATPSLVSSVWLAGLFTTATAAVFAAPLVHHRRVIASLDDVGLPTLIGAFLLLGTSLFSLGFALGTATRAAAETIGSAAAAADTLSVSLSIAAATVLAFALTLTQNLEGREKLASWRAAATAVGLIAILGLVAGLLLAWPWPALMLAVALLDTAVLVWIAMVCRVPWTHAGAIATATVACLTAYHLIVGNLAWNLAATAPTMVRTLFGGESAVVLVGFCGLLAALAARFRQADLSADARIYGGGAAVVAAVSVMASAWAAWFQGGVAVPMAMVVFTIYGAVSLAGNAVVRIPAVTHTGLALLVGATFWALYWIVPSPSPIWATVLGIEALALAVVGFLLDRASPREGDADPADHPERMNFAPARLVEAYRLPVLDLADGLAGVTLALSAVVLLPNLTQYTYTAWPAVALLAAAVAWLVVAWVRRSPERTWIGSITILAMLAHTFVYCLPDLLYQPWIDAVLMHATLGVAATLACQWIFRGSAEERAKTVRRVFVEPASQSAALTSTLALPLLLVNSWEHTLTLSLCLFWLSAIWLVVAAANRLPGLVTAAQAVMCLATVAAATTWLERYPWSRSGIIELNDLRTWQTYGAALALLVLAWTITRVALRGVKQAGELLNPEWPSLDRLVGGGLCVLHLLAAAGAMFPPLGHELGTAPATPAATLQAAVGSPAGWCLWGTLAVCCGISAWNRWRETEMVCGLVVLGTLPWLVAAVCGVNVDAASALRWGSAGVLAIGTVAVCGRKSLADWARGLTIRVDTEATAPPIARATLLCLTLLPVIGLTVASALLQLGGTSPTGPAQGSFFAATGTEVSYLVPLLAAAAALVALAYRETSSGYAFSAGLVTKLGLLLACLLSFTTIGAEEWAILGYSLALASAVWAAVWIAARRWIDVWQENRPGPAPQLMRLELAIGTAGAALVLVPGLFGLIEVGPVGVSQISVAAGGWLGWLAIGAVFAAAVYRQSDLRRPVPADLAGLAGLTLIGLAACTVSSVAGPLGLSAHGVRWGYHTMMIGWAAYSVLIALSTWWMAEHVRIPGAEGPPQVLIRAANVWVIASGVLAVLLGLLAASAFSPPEERLWGAAAIGLASAASATMAVWRRREVWAFVSGLGVNVAASFTVSYFERAIDPWSGFLLLVEANIIAGAVVALAWLAVRKRLYALREKAVYAGPLLGIQVGLTAAAALALVVPTLVALVASPGDLPLVSLRQIGSAPGAVAVALAAAAAGWYLLQVRPQVLVHVVGTTALSAGVMLGAGAVGWTEWFTADDWLPYHVLIAAWTALGVLLLAATVGAASWSTGTGDIATKIRAALPAEPACLWHFALTLSAAAAGLIWCADDPQRPYWAGGVMLAAAASTAGAALWNAGKTTAAHGRRSLRERTPFSGTNDDFVLPAPLSRSPLAEIVLSGVLLNLAGNVAWIAWSDHQWAGLVETNALCLAAGAAVWTLLQAIVPGRVAGFTLSQREHSYAEFALQAALVLLGGLAAAIVGFTLTGTAHPGPSSLTWWTIAAVAGVLVLRLLLGLRQFSLPGLYYLGLIALLISLDPRAESPRHLLWLAGPELAAYALAVGAVLFALRRSGFIRDESTERNGYFGVLYSQWGVAALVAALATATALDGAFGGLSRSGLAWLAPGRWAGPLAAIGLLAAAVLMAESLRGWGAVVWRYAALGAGALAVATAGWAWLPIGDVNPLNQTVVFMVAAVTTLLVGGVGLPRLLPEQNPWVTCGRNAIPGFGLTAAVALVLVLVQQAILFEPEAGAPTALWAVVVVTAALASMIVALIAFAVSPQRDPLGLTDQGRTAYVYAAEALGGLVALHLWLAEPKLFQLGLLDQYWMLLVIGIAFLGVGLSEWFQRMGLPVLSRPLANTAALLPLIPAIGYWVPTGVAPSTALAGSSPAVWFSGSLFYAVMATTQRSRTFSFLALGTLATAFCLLWQDMELGLADHVQLYGIPIGLAILLAEQIHHRELNRTVASTMRYVALTFIYLTSSAEFLWQLGETFWMPATLICLSILGILSGIFLRIRSFVIVGFTSMALVLGSLVYYAAVDQQQSWVFAVALLALGSSLLVFFMIFESKKAQILATLNRFWNWQRRDLVASGHEDQASRRSQS